MRWTKHLAIVASLLIAGTSANAELIPIDLNTPHDARIVRDTESGLDWLRAGGTGGLSFAQVSAGEGGWLDAGWRYATLSEVCELLAPFGFNCPGTTRKERLVGNSGMGLASRLVSRYNPYPDDCIFGCIDLFVSAGIYAGAGQFVVDGRAILCDCSPGTISYTAYIGASILEDPETTTRAGQMLVRNFQAVPEPGTGALAGVGLALLGLARRRARA